MGISDNCPLEVILERLRAIHEELSGHHAGVAVLHLDAAVAALESHIRRLPVADEAGPSVGAAAD